MLINNNYNVATKNYCNSHSSFTLLINNYYTRHAAALGKCHAQYLSGNIS